MPDTGKRISELSAATANTGAELIPEVQGGVTVSDSVADIRGVDDAIVDGVTGRSPSQNVVYDALALKEDAAAAVAMFVRYDVDNQTLTDMQKTNALTNLGLDSLASLGSMATQAADAVAITGGTIIGLTDLEVARFRGLVGALSALAIDCSTGDHFTKSISSASTFTVANVPAGSFGFSLELTITSAAVPTWFSGVKWAGGFAPTLGNGLHLLFFFTSNGGTTWFAAYGKAFA